MLEESLLQFVAGVGLIDATRLLRWSVKDNQFVLPQFGTEFVQSWMAFDPAYGRAAFWNIFSTGAELLLKGTLLANGHDVRDAKKVIKHPQTFSGSDFEEWVRLCSMNPLNVERENTVIYGQLHGAIEQFRLWRGITESVAASDRASNLIVAAFELLRSGIRNRDTHAYVPNVRANHIQLVEALFMPAFNACVQFHQDPTEITRQWLARGQHRPQPTTIRD